jgi:hypothetical protein
MPFSPPVSTLPQTGSATPSRWRSLAVVSAGVVLAHLTVLQGLPTAFASLSGVAQPRSGDLQAFSTRMITPPGAQRNFELPREVPARITSRAAAPKVALAPPAPAHQRTVASEANQESNSALSPENSALAAIKSVASDAPTVLPPQLEDRVLLAAATPAKPEPAAKATAKPAESLEIRNVVIAAPMRLKYDVRGEIKGFPYFANGELLWTHDGVNYAAKLEISHFILGSRSQTSKGTLTPVGLEPIRFGDKVRSEVAAHFERAKGKVSFSSNAPDVPLQAGAQDQLSLFMQMGAMIAGEPGRFVPGTLVPFQAIGPRSSEWWVFKIGETEWLKLPAGDFRAIKITRDANGEFDPRGEVWLAPELGYLPVRIRLIQANGDFVEQSLHSLQKL